MKRIEELPLEAAAGLSVDPWRETLDLIAVKAALALLRESDAEMLLIFASEDGDLRRTARRLKRSARVLREEINQLIRQVRTLIHGKEDADETS